MQHINMNRSVRIHRVSEVQSRVAELNKRALKLGMDPLTITVGEPFREERVVDGKATMVWLKTIHIAGVMPRIDGWFLAAVIERVGDAGVLVRSVPGLTGAPDMRGFNGASCDHCKAKRYRKETFVLLNDAKDTKQVGRECLRDFLGHDPEKLISWQDMLADLEDALDEDAGGGGGEAHSSVVDLHEFLVYCAATYRVSGGFFTRKMVEEGKAKTTTAEDAMGLWSACTKAAKEGNTARLKEILPRSDVDGALADQAIAWAQAIQVKSDFDNNLKVTADAGFFNRKSVGVAAYVLGGYLREQNRLFVEKAKDTVYLPVEQQKHLGNEGERLTFDGVMLMGTHVFDGQFGTTHIYRLAIQGCHAVWFSSRLEHAFQPLSERYDRPRTPRTDELTQLGTDRDVISADIQEFEAGNRRELNEEGRELDAWEKAQPYPPPPGPFRITGTIKKLEQDRKKPDIPVTVLTRVTVWTFEDLREDAEKAAKKAARGANKAAKAEPRSNPADGQWIDSPKTPRVVRDAGWVMPGHVFHCWPRGCGAEITWGHEKKEKRPCLKCSVSTQWAYGYAGSEENPLCADCAHAAARSGEKFGHKCPKNRYR